MCAFVMGALTALFIPHAAMASPYIIGYDPSMNPVWEYDISRHLDTNDVNPQPNDDREESPPSWQTNRISEDPELYKIFGDNDVARVESKRSGLRAALVARTSRGFQPGFEMDFNDNSLTRLGNHVFIAPPSIVEGNLITRRSQPANAPYLSVGRMSGAKDAKGRNERELGVLSDVDQYFKDLKNQLDKMVHEPESVPAPPPGQSYRFFGASRGGPRPAATAAYLHALRSHGPSHRIRSFVEDPGPMELRGANSHDPALLWTGLGRR